MSKKKIPFYEKIEELSAKGFYSGDSHQLEKDIIRREEALKRDLTDQETLTWIGKQNYRKDLRSAEEYIYNIHEGWFFEDYFFELIKNSKSFRNFSVEQTGCDKERKVILFDGPYNVTSDPDFLLKENGTDRKIHIQFKFANNYNKDGSLNIKPSRYDSDDDYYYMFYIFETNECFIFPFKKISESGIELISNRKWGNKLTYKIDRHWVFDNCSPLDLWEFHEQINNESWWL